MKAPPSSEMNELDALVEQTRGVQPFRRLFHAFTGTAVAVALTWLDLPRASAVVILGTVLVGQIALDVVRLRMPQANAAFFRAFRHLASPREARGLASSTWYTLGLLLAVTFFPGRAAISGVLVLALSDPAASYVGQRWGRRPLLGGSVVGSLAFILVALAVLLPRHAAPVAIGATVAGLLTERLSWPLDDNLTLPPATAAAITLLEWAL
jgi:dolichol kinase